MKPPEFQVVPFPSEPWQDSFSESVSPSKIISDNKELHWKDDFAGPVFPWQINPELTCQNNFTKSFSPWQANEQREPAMFAAGITSYPNIHIFKENYFSLIGLWPKNKPTHFCEKRSPEYKNVFYENIANFTVLNTAECLIPNFSRERSKNPIVKFLINKSKSPIYSTCRRNDKKYSDSPGSIEKCQEVNNTEGNIQTIQGKSLYRLDLTSPLGQFVIQHFKSDSNLQISSNIESHCLTSNQNMGAGTSRLRERHITYPITFKGCIRKFGCRHVHQYNFTRQQKLEFMRRVNSGLDKKSRILFKTLKPCKVRLSQLMRSDMKRWMLTSYDVFVKLKPLSTEEISYWMSPKADISTNSSCALFCSVKSLSSQVKKIWTQDVSIFNKYNQHGLILSDQTFVHESISRIVTYNCSVSDVIKYENCASEVENLQIPIFNFRNILSPSLSPNSETKIHTLPDIANVDQILSLPIKKTKYSEDVKTYKSLSSKCLTCHTKLGSFVTYSSKYSRLCCLQSSCIKSCRNINNQHKVRSVRSGIYNVRIQTSEDGKMIKSVVKLHAESEHGSSKSRKVKQIENTFLSNKASLSNEYIKNINGGEAAGIVE